MNSLLNFSIQTGIEVFAIKLLAEATKSDPEHLKTYFAISIFPDEGMHQDVSNGEKVVLIPGVCCSLNPNSNAYDIIKSLRPKIEYKGYRIFVTEGNHLEDKRKIAIVRCMDEFTPLVYMQTNGGNYGLETLQLVRYLSNLSESLDLKLVGADNDWCEYEIQKEPDDWAKLANSLYELCPDIVEQGTGDVDALTEELIRSKRLYLWFD